MSNSENRYKTFHNSSLFDLAKLKELGGYKAGDLLAVDPELYGKFMQHLSKTVKHDEVTRNIVFSTAISAYTPEPINLFLRGESSIGKTYNVVQATKYFRKEDVWLLGSLSPTALIHDRGKLVDRNGEEIIFQDKPEKPIESDYQDNRDFTEAMRDYKEKIETWKKRLEDCHYVVDLTNKILVFLEAPHFRTFNMLRPILSHDASEISYKFTDKSGKGQLQTQHVVIRGWPATIFCSTQEKYVQDLATRGFTITPEATKDKYRDANLLTGSIAAFPWKFQRDFDFMLLEGYIRFLKNHLEDVKVVVPYAMEFAENFPCRFSRSMRDFKHVLNLIEISALFHFAQRPIVIRKVKVEGEDPTVPEYKEVEECYIMAVRQDYDFVMALWNEIHETTETSAPGHIIKFYHEVVEEVAKDKQGEFLIEDLTDKWNSKFEEKKSSDTIRRWAGFLSDIGYLSKRTDPGNKTRNLLRIIHENGKFRKDTHLSFPDIFGLDSFKAWLNEHNSINARNEVLLRENLVSNNQTLCEDIFNKYFLRKSCLRAVIGLSDSKASFSESAKEIHANQKCVFKRNFQKKIEKDQGQITLDNVKYSYWADEFYGEHECAICGYNKLTSWKAELFKGLDVWICEDCKLEWDKRQEAT